MPLENPKFDIAISFLAEDIALATALYEKLCGGYSIFFFPRSQDDLAGTDGLESMREPFRNQSRINVVLYKEKWGNTPWTAVEAAAIKDKCLATAYKSLFFFVVEPSDALPGWLPDTHIRFNYGEFTLDDAVGAIQTRVKEQGGQYAPLTPAKRAVIFKADEAYRRDKEQMMSRDGLEKIHQAALFLLNEIVRHCDEVNRHPEFTIRREIDFRDDAARKSCIMTSGNVGMIVSWHKPFINATTDMELIVKECSGPLLLQEDIGRRVYFRPLREIRVDKYVADLSPARQYGWSRGKNQPFISSVELAIQCVNQFIELLDRDARGAIHRKPIF